MTSQITWAVLWTEHYMVILWHTFCASGHYIQANSMQSDPIASGCISVFCCKFINYPFCKSRLLSIFFDRTHFSWTYPGSDQTDLLEHGYFILIIIGNYLTEQNPGSHWKLKTMSDIQFNTGITFWASASKVIRSVDGSTQSINQSAWGIIELRFYLSNIYLLCTRYVSLVI